MTTFSFPLISFFFPLCTVKKEHMMSVVYYNWILISSIQSVHAFIYMGDLLVLFEYTHTLLTVRFIMKNAIKLTLLKDANIIGKNCILFSL